MAIYNFGVGNLIGRRTDVANPTPVRFGVLQDLQIDVDADNKMLVGQYQMPVDVARGQLKVKCSAKFARIQANAYNDLFFGLTPVNTNVEQVVVDEAHAAGTTITIAPPNSGVFAADLGVFYQATGGQLTRSSSASAVGIYSVNEATGVYSFNAGETGTLLISYRYTIATSTTLTIITLTNQLMGAAPVFQIEAQESYTNNAGIVGSMHLRFNACKASKLSLPFKNTDYTISSFDFDVFADQSNNWGEWTFNAGANA